MHHWNLILIFILSVVGDGMNAYVAYKVSTRVCSHILCVFTWLLKYVINFTIVSKCFMSFACCAPPDVFAHVQE